MTASLTRAETDPVAGPEIAALETEVAARLPLAGGVLSGPLVLAGNPAANLEAVPRQYVASQIAALVNGAPSTLDTLNEIAAQLGNDESAVAALTATVAGKLSSAANLGDLANAVTARANLGTDAAGAARPPTAHKSSHATGGSDVLTPGDIAALATSSRGAANGVASLDVNQRVGERRADQAILARELSDLARTGWIPDGAIAETFPRNLALASLGLTAGRLFISGGIVVPGGRTVSSVSFISNAAAAGLTHQWFVIGDRAGNVLAKTVDDLAVAWGANAKKTLALSAPWTPANATEIYVGIVVTGATPPTVWRTGSSLGAAAGMGSGMGDNSTAGLTDPSSLGANFAVAAGQNAAYAFVS